MALSVILSPVSPTAAEPLHLAFTGGRSRTTWQGHKKKDSFRGVDGRRVVDYQALYNPPDDFRPPKYTEEDRKRVKLKVAEINRKLLEKVEQEKRVGVNTAEKYACDRVTSDYDLTPRG